MYVSVYFAVPWRNLQKKQRFLTPSLVYYSYRNNDTICLKHSKVTTEILQFCFMKTYKNVLFQGVPHKKNVQE